MKLLKPLEIRVQRSSAPLLASNASRYTEPGCEDDSGEPTARSYVLLATPPPLLPLPLLLPLTVEPLSMGPRIAARAVPKPA